MLHADKLLIISLFTAINVAANVTCWGIAMKYNLLERYEVYKKKWMPSPCIICISFWFATIYTIPIAFMLQEPLLLICPFLAAGFTVRYSFPFR